MTDMPKSMKLKLEKSKAWSKSELSADRIFRKMIAAEITQLPDNVKPLSKYKINGVILKYQTHSNQSTVQQFISPPIIPSASFTSNHFSTPSINSRPTGSCEPYQTGSWFDDK